VSLCEKLEQRKLWPDWRRSRLDDTKEAGYRSVYMHYCLRYDVVAVVEDAVLDSTRSIVIQQAGMTVCCASGTETDFR
jgi:ppGpp synthetase/RelA/SpoT-type nucleotidyltranferase